MKPQHLGVASGRAVGNPCEHRRPIHFVEPKTNVFGMLLRGVSFGLVLAGMLAVSACSSRVQEQIRAATYPPDFNYIPAEKLRSTMWQLAAHASELDRLMRGTETGSPPREEVLRLLEAMERTSGELGPGSWPSNHPRVSHNIDAFRREVALARQGVERDPPSYFRAGAVTGACTQCHLGD